MALVYRLALCLIPAPHRKEPQSNAFSRCYHRLCIPQRLADTVNMIPHRLCSSPGPPVEAPSLQRLRHSHGARELPILPATRSRSYPLPTLAGGDYIPPFFTTSEHPVDLPCSPCFVDATLAAAEWERRREKFVKELDFVFCDVVMAIVADFMLVWLPAPTVSLRAPLQLNTGPISKFFYSCPDNAFQIALAGTTYSFLQRVGAILRNGSKLFIVGTGASMIGTGITNGLIKARQAIGKDFGIETEDVPIISTSVAYGVYMATSSNLRYQVLAGVIEQRILEPLLHSNKLALSASCFAVRTGNTFLGSLLWVDYARWVGVQKSNE